MQLSSLIFLVIVAIWAAYLIQHWVRRREHVATARSVDRFSEAMRVLERRSPLPRPELATPHPHSYALKPASSRPAVVVKRATTVAAVATREARATSRVSETVAHRSPLTARRPGAGTAATAPARTPSRPVLARPHRTSTEVLVRKLRGVAFLVTLGAVPVTAALSALHILLWVSVAIALVAFVAVVGWLRHGVLREQARARAARRVPRGTPLRGTAAARETSKTTESSEEEDAEERSAQATPRELASRVVFDAAAPVAGAAHASSERFVAEAPAPLTPGGWSPVPVPPPTYTLKDAAPRRAPEPAEVTQRPVPIDVEDDEIELMLAAHQRRVVGG